jgi:hypothetical protein
MHGPDAALLTIDRNAELAAHARAGLRRCRGKRARGEIEL